MAKCFFKNTITMWQVSFQSQLTSQRFIRIGLTDYFYILCTDIHNYHVKCSYFYHVTAMLPLSQWESLCFTYNCILRVWNVDLLYEKFHIGSLEKERKYFNMPCSATGVTLPFFCCWFQKINYYLIFCWYHIHVNLLPQKCWRNLQENWLKNGRILSVFDM